MILYPTETLYALGVNAFDSKEIAKLNIIKDRDKSKVAISWLVRDMDDIARYAEIPEKATKIAEQFLPGSLTLVLKSKIDISNNLIAKDRTIGFRLTSDPIAQKLIAEYMEEHNAPLTCTSANVSGLSTLATPSEILQQFGSKASMITKTTDDGPRKGLASTVVRVLGDDVTVLREGEITQKQVEEAILS